MKTKRPMKRGEKAIGGDWALQNGARFPFRNLRTGVIANFDARPANLKKKFPVKREVNIFMPGGFEYIIL